MKTKDAIQNIFEYSNYSRNNHNCQHLNTLVKLQPAQSPHIAGEYCADCGRWIRWIGKKEYYSKNHQNSVKGGAK